jgi:hypothetical protein
MNARYPSCVALIDDGKVNAFNRTVTIDQLRDLGVLNDALRESGEALYEALVLIDEKMLMVDRNRVWAAIATVGCLRINLVNALALAKNPNRDELSVSVASVVGVAKRRKAA